MNKKFLSLVLALVMVLGTFGNVFAAAAPDKKEVKEVPKLTTTEAKVQWLIDEKIVVGIADKDGKAIGDMDLKSPIRRDAVAKMIVYAIGEKDLAAKLQGAYRPFPDVETSNIMNGLITVAASKTNVNGVPIIVGYEDGMFRPTQNVTYAELAKMLVVAIDKDLTPAVAKTYSWPQGWLDRAAKLGIFDGLSIDKANAPAVRSDAFAMVYNAFAHLKELKAVPANEFRGVISERSDGTTLVLNQGDFKKEFKVNKDTIFVNQAKVAQKWLYNKAAENNYYVGSVVRVLVDKDGVVSHIIEMGNPVVGIKNAGVAWVDLGNKTLKLAQSDWNAAKGSVTLGSDFVQFNKANKIVLKFELTKDTKYYVADPDLGVLTEVKDYAAAKAVVGDKTSNAYVAYEKLPASGVNEAKVVVFNKAKLAATSRIVRVAKAVSRPDYMLSVNAPGEAKTPIEQFDLSKVDNVWPYNYNLDALDVFELVYNGKAYKGNEQLLIDHSEDPVYKVEKFLLVEGAKEKEVNREQANVLVLSDKDGYQQRFDIPKDAKLFFGNEIVAGAHVQIAVRADNNSVLRVISVVNDPLKGILKNGVDMKLVKGKVLDVAKDAGHDGLIRVNVREEGQREGEFTTFVTALNWNDVKALEGKNIVAKVKFINKDYNPAEIVKIVEVNTTTELDKKVNELLNSVELDAQGRLIPNAKNKEIIEKAKEAYVYGNPASEKTQESKDAINFFIALYNGADKVATNDIAPIA